MKKKLLKIIDNKKNDEANCKVIIDKLYNNNYINEYTVDIASCLIEYIKDNIFNVYVRKVLLKLEDNNILTTLVELTKKDFKEIDKSLIEEIIKKYLDEITSEKFDTILEPKFLFNYNVPGLYNFYRDISNYINKNITTNYFNNEKKLREVIISDIEEVRQFHDTEDSLFDNVSKYIANNKFFFEILNKIPNDLILKDYITYYLQKYRNKNDVVYYEDDVYHKLIELLLELRFKEEKYMNCLLMKMIWIESNINYILNILKIYDNIIPIFNNDRNKLYNKIEQLINDNKIKYVSKDNKNQNNTKIVNECFYIILASICYSIASNEIELTTSISNKNNGLIEINHYYYILTDIYKIMKNLRDDLCMLLNEIYVIDKLIKIIELFKKKDNFEIKNLMRENALIIQKYSNNEVKLIEELINNFEAIYNSIIRDEIK